MEKFSSDFIRDLFRSICQLARENAAQKIALRLSEFTPEPKSRFEEAPLVFEEKISYSVRAYTTDEIIVGIFSDDPEVYRFINRFYFPEVRHYILANSGTPVQAQDIFAEGLAIMLEKKREGILHFTANPGTWLYGVCRNLWRNELRKRGKTLDDYSYEPATDPVDPETEPDYYDICREEIGKLGSKCRELLFQTIYESKKIGEIAAALGYSTPHSASTQKRKCLDRLSKNVKERLQETVE